MREKGHPELYLQDSQPRALAFPCPRLRQEESAGRRLPGSASRDASAAAGPKSEQEIREDVANVVREDERVRRELESAAAMMNEGEDMSPEELLKSVLKFGEETEKEESPGGAFPGAAFGKAQELLRGEREGTRRDVQFREPESADDARRKAEEDELRRIFAAGQDAAEQRLSKPASQPLDTLSPPSMTEADIDALIDAEDMIPRNARKLDDELAEFEVRVSRSGESDGPYKPFDVLSGPEEYNPNVDPATAVNWPGAKAGTRTDVQLAAELESALKQAQFASAVLKQMREVVDDGNGEEVRYFVGNKELSMDRVTLLRSCVKEAAKAGIIDDPEVLETERSRLQMLLDELMPQPEERLEEIALVYKDLLLSDNLLELIKERLQAMRLRDLAARREGTEDSLEEPHARERAILIKLVQIAQVLVKEAQALGAELETSMLEIIRSICDVAMDPSHTSEEDTALALTDAVRDMRPLLDDAFVAYLKYAIAEEEGKLARAGVLDDPEHNRWLFVLKIVQEGVYAELSQGVNRLVTHVFYILRMETKSERRMLLEKLVDVMPTMDVRPFVRVVDNIVSSLGTSVKGDFKDGIILGEMTNQLLQLQKDMSEVLPPERINEMSKDADAWAARQRKKVLERRNLTKQRLEAERQTADIDVEKLIKKPGAEAERFDQ